MIFSRARKKGFSFFSCGATPSRTVPKTQPLQVAFSLLERVDLRFQRGDYREENWLGKGGVDRAKKGKKDAQKKGGNLCLVGISAPKKIFTPPPPPNPCKHPPGPSTALPHPPRRPHPSWDFQRRIVPSTPFPAPRTRPAPPLSRKE